jgi:hypothetical protein
MTTYNYQKSDQNVLIKKSENFLFAELDVLNSSYKMLMYREGFSHPNTYYSKKKDFNEPDDKEYLMLSMIERFIGRNNCFFRKFEQTNGKTYSPATLIEFWRIFQDDTEERLVLRMYHPTKNMISFELFDYMEVNESVKMRLIKYYELMRLGKTDAIGKSKARCLEQDELKDFFWLKVPLPAFAKHIAHLYSKYPSRGRIDIYKETYLLRHYPEQPIQSSIKQPTVIQPSIAEVSVVSVINKPTEVSTIWAKCLQFIGSKVNQDAFCTWFIPIIPIKLEGNKLCLQLPSMFFYEQLEENYITILEEMLDDILGQGGQLEYKITG